MNESETRAYDSNWHLDKKVPIVLILAILGQGIGFVWLAAKFDARLENVERTQTASSPQGDRITRMEVKVENIERGVFRIENVLQSRTPTGFNQLEAPRARP